MPWLKALLWIALLAPAGIEIYQFQSAHLVSQPIWAPLGWHHFERYLVLSILAFAVVYLTLRKYAVPLILSAIFVCSIRAVGLIPVGALGLFILSSIVLGKLVFGRKVETRLAFLAGLGLWISAITLTARLPIHYPVVYLIAMAAVIGVGWRNLRDIALSPKLNAMDESLGFFVLTFVLGAHWLIVLKPEVSTDGLSMHLAIADGFARLHAFTFDVQHNIWALMPLAADYGYGIAYVLGGEYAARLLNFAMLLAIVVLIYHLCRMFVSRPAALAIAALFASTPLVQLITGSMFVDNFVAAMTLGGFAGLLRFRQTLSMHYLLLTAFLLGTAAAMKLGAIAIVAFVLALLVWGAWRTNRLAAVSALIIFAAAGGFPYASAYWQTGDPVFPFAASTFHPRLVQDDLKDVRFDAPLTWRTPSDITFHTSGYLESQDGAFGFQYFLLLPLSLLGLIWKRPFASTSAMAIGISSAGIILATKPNARYVYIALPFLMVGFAAALQWLNERNRPLFFAAAAAASIAFLGNIYFLPASGWYHKEFYTSPMFSASGRQAYLGSQGPVREIVRYVNAKAGTSPVFYADGSQIAGLVPPAHRNHWHDYAFLKKVESCSQAKDVYALLAGLGVEYMIVDREYQTKRQQSVTDLIGACGQVEYSLVNFSAVKLRDDCPTVLAGR